MLIPGTAQGEAPASARAFDPRLAATLALQGHAQSPGAVGQLRPQHAATAAVERARLPHDSPRMWAMVAMATVVGVVAFALLIAHFNSDADAQSSLIPPGINGSGGEQSPAKTDPPAGSKGAAVATAASTQTPTATPSPTEMPSPTPTATLEPPTPTPTPPPPTPTPRPPTPTPTVGAAAGTAVVAGRWTLTDTVTRGDASGSVFSFNITIAQAGAVITGGGGGLTIRGTVSGNRISATFTRAGGGGAFEWTMQGDGSLAGTFSDEGAGNSGTSIARR